MALKLAGKSHNGKLKRNSDRLPRGKPRLPSRGSQAEGMVALSLRRHLHARPQRFWLVLPALLALRPGICHGCRVSSRRVRALVARHPAACVAVQTTSDDRMPQSPNLNCTSPAALRPAPTALSLTPLFSCYLDPNLPNPCPSSDLNVKLNRTSMGLYERFPYRCSHTSAASLCCRLDCIAAPGQTDCITVPVGAYVTRPPHYFRSILFHSPAVLL